MLTERRECDVYGTTKDVKVVTVGVWAKDVGSDDDADQTSFEATDMSPRALKRLFKFIRRGLSKPGT